MHLALAIRTATAYKMSEDRIEDYTKYMHKYLTLLITIDPSLRLHPNHHNALHIGDHLRRFGPMHGWWMYPFERTIGKLQNSNINFKFGKFASDSLSRTRINDLFTGEMEKTTMNSFCEAANLKAFLQRPDLKSTLR